MGKENYHKFAPPGSELDKLVKYYEDNHRLPRQYVRCTRSGRDITMYGPNLERRIVKYGGIRQLLSTFICRDAIKEDLAKNIIHNDIPSNRRGPRKPLPPARAPTVMPAQQPEKKAPAKKD